jgi:hypothetical protein
MEEFMTVEEIVEDLRNKVNEIDRVIEVLESLKDEGDRD